MSAFRYQAIEGNGAPVSGVIEAEDRRTALQMLSKRGLFPSSLEASNGASSTAVAAPIDPNKSNKLGINFGARVGRKEITAFTGEMSALLGAGIPIPQALDGLAEQEENPLLKAMVNKLSESVRKGAALSTAMEENPRMFGKLYVSMVRVGEEAGVLPGVMADLAELLQHEDDVRSEVNAAVAYPLFVMAFGIITVVVLLTFVLPKLFTMMNDMTTLPLPTLILLSASKGFHKYWILLFAGAVGIAVGIRWFVSKPKGAELWDRVKLHLPVMGSVFRAAALSRFARTLGTLVKSGVSLLPALKIVESTIGNIVLARSIAQVAEETRGGDSLAAPLRKLGIFPKTVIQMISVGEETGKLDEMLLKVAFIEERHMRARMKTMISLLAPAMIMVVGAMVGFMVIAILLPIFKMSRAVH